MSGRSRLSEAWQAFYSQDICRLPRVLPYAIGMLLLVSSCVVFRGIYDGALSPWLWEQFGTAVVHDGWLAALIMAVLYLAFYGWSFAVPYGLLWLVLLHGNRSGFPAEIRGSLRVAITTASLGCFLLFVSLLTPEIAFLRAFFAASAWLTLVVAMGFVLLVAGIWVAWEETRSAAFHRKKL